MIAGTLLLMLAGFLANALYLCKPTERVRAVRFLVAAPEKVTSRWFDLPVISPDGERLVFSSATADGQGHLWVRPLNSLAAEMLSGTEGASFPFWSPDSRSIAFFAGGKLKKIDVSGGPSQTLSDVAGTGGGGAWNREGVIVFAPASPSSLYRVAAAGGEAMPLTTLDPSRHEVSHRWPYFLPDGRHFIYFALSAQQEHLGIYVGSLDSKETRRILITDRKAAYAPPGYLLFVRGNTLMAEPFDLKKLESAGEPFPVAEQFAQYTSYAFAAFSVSENGVLAYQASAGSRNTQLVWFDRTGKRLGPVGEPADYSNPSLSPDGQKLAVGRRDPKTKTRDIWVFDLTRGTSSRVTFDPSDDLNPVWSRDGSRILFTSDRKGPRDIYQKMANGTGADELVLASDDDKNVIDWSSDGQFVAYDTGAGGQGGNTAVWVLPLFGDRKLIPFLRTQFSERQAQFAPNGRWIAYTSDESGKDQVYVQTFPQAGGKWQVSTGGGLEPRWRRDGKELFYLADTKLMAVPVKTDSSTFEAGTPKLLFETRVVPPGNIRNSYVVTSDGQRFLVNVPVEQTSSSPMTVVVNWMADLKK